MGMLTYCPRRRGLTAKEFVENYEKRNLPVSEIEMGGEGRGGREEGGREGGERRRGEVKSVEPGHSHRRHPDMAGKRELEV